jgi:prepilin-type N-terminal cleavage/methylation domain-containing protein/prepilin-type processing-associated H-X9-DG protein
MRISRSGSLTYGRTGRGGFSLVELVVVIAVITVVAGMVLATVSRARGQAEQVKCSAQLQQLGAAFATFSIAHKGWLPAWSGWHVYPPGSSGEDEPGESWTEQLTPYYVPPDSPVYTCPAFQGPVVTYFMSGRWSASQSRRSMKLSELKFASLFVLSGDMTNRHLYIPPYGQAKFRRSNDSDPDDSNAPCTVFPRDDGGFLMHKSGNNILFGDLHVQALRAYDPTAVTFDAREMKRWDDVLPPPDVP